jgi:hypothetical protein
MKEVDLRPQHVGRSRRPLTSSAATGCRATGFDSTRRTSLAGLLAAGDVAGGISANYGYSEGELRIARLHLERMEEDLTALHATTPFELMQSTT